ncbi:septum site-determining protein Ssd [Mumia sp. ZJ430]|uniref:septum site-determining protein Ssd n=1 Tax=Mumia sp. ZJ430 TaxID=2708083 RepID=UPI0014244C93|nr:septum site-determining protein Ssd [Mumia sp. ZJ430]
MVAYTGSAGPVRPLLVTASEQRLESVLRLCAAAGVEPNVCADVGAARQLWPRAGLVVIGDDALDEVASAALERRADVVVIADESPDPQVWGVALAVGADRVLALPRDDSTLCDALADGVEGAGQDAPVLAVVGGCGGAGASSLAAAVAMTATRDRSVTDRHGGASVLLVDADPWGGGLDVLLGVEATPGLRWSDLTGTHGRLSGAALSRSLPRVDDLAVLAWDRGAIEPAAPETVRAVLAAGRRVHDLVVADLPRHLDTPVEEILARATSVVLVVPDDVRAVGAASGVAEGLAGWASNVGLVVRRRRRGLPPELVADTLGMPLVATVDDDPRFRLAVEEGLGPLARRTSVRRAAREVLDVLGPELGR